MTVSMLLHTLHYTRDDIGKIDFHFFDDYHGGYSHVEERDEALIKFGHRSVTWWYPSYIRDVIEVNIHLGV